MRILLTFCFLTVAVSVNAQEETLFKIITFSPGVTLSGRPAAFGIDVVASDKKLAIPKDGYCGVITSEGNSHKLVESIPVKQVVGLVRRKYRDVLVVGQWPDQYWNLMFMFPRFYSSSRVVGDSLFLFWASRISFESTSSGKIAIQRPPRRPYRVVVKDMFDDQKFAFTANSNWLATKVPEDKGMLYQVLCDSPKLESEQFMIARANPKLLTHVGQQLSQIPVNADSEFLRCAVFELNDLVVDMQMAIYHILSRHMTPTDPLLQKYMDYVTRKYHLELLDMDK